MTAGHDSAATPRAPALVTVTRLDHESDAPATPLGEILAVEAMAHFAFAGTGMSLTEELARPWSRIWVAREETAGGSGARRIGDPTGFLLAWHVADELHILNVATSASMRRCGVATALLSHGLAYARDNAIRIVVLEVRRSNRPAIGLYRKLDFTVLGVRAGYYSDNGEDAIEMILGLDPVTGAVLQARDEIKIDG
jgi:ribosomal-protein-alanine N-acetyltransferase